MSIIEQQTIPKQAELSSAEDFDALREEGLALIQKLAGHIWTDHNLHDPGITTLEALCYAITDLGYRTQFSTADLLSSRDGYLSEPENSALFPAHQALTCQATTPLDFRQLLVRIDGVRNAWILPRKQNPWAEQAVYADFANSSLSFDADNASGHENMRVQISGLYDVQLELNPDPLFGSLNESALPVELIGSAFHANAKVDSAIIEFASPVDHVKQRQLWSEIASDDLVANVNVSFARLTTVKTRIDIEYQGAPLPSLHIVFENEVANRINRAHYLQVLFEQPFNALAHFIKKQARIILILQRACCALQHNRLLCEDWVKVDTVQAEYVGICSDIDIETGADLEQVQAAIVFAIEQYLNPPVVFHTLQTLLAQGYQVDDIFNTPFIDKTLKYADKEVFSKRGFVLNHELAQADIRSSIYSSDIINILMDIPGVEKVKSFSMRAYDSNAMSISNSELWELQVSPGYQPVFTPNLSKFLLFKQGIPFTVQQQEYKTSLAHLRKVFEQQAYIESPDSLQMPIGQKRDTLTHYPVQNDFPQTYKIGEHGISERESHQRINKSKQFKAYLLFFEQVLADYLAQLHHFPTLFSINSDSSQSYFSQYLSNVKGSVDAFEDEVYLDKALQQRSDYQNALYVDSARHLSRKNALLDHLLARFAEQFSDYALLMLKAQGNTANTQSVLIEDKAAFLREQPILSRQRSRAFAYSYISPEQVWQSDNVSGLEKRICRLAGIDDFTRRDLSCSNFAAVFLDTRRTGDEYRVEIKTADNFLLFKSFELFASRELAMDKATAMFDLLDQDSSYTVQAKDGRFVWFLGSEDKLLLQDKTFTSEAQALADIDKTRERVSEAIELSMSASELFDTREYGRDFRIEVKDAQQNILFKSKKLYKTKVQASKVADALFAQFHDKDIFKVNTNAGTGTASLTLSGTGFTLVHGETFDNEIDAYQRASTLMARYYEVLESEVCDQEGLYLIEHILLRPHTDSSELMSVCLDNESACSDEDPYSFKASLVLPYWPKRFQDIAFREFLETLAREQTPAHIMLKICWIDDFQMRELQSVYKEYLFALATHQHASPVCVEAQAKLIKTLESLRTVFPQAVLHDCEDDDDAPPVRLGQTNLSG